MALGEKRREIFLGAKKGENAETGFISHYSKTNAKEDFAEHFASFLLENTEFKRKSEEEKIKNRDETLQNKFQFMEKLFNTKNDCLQIAKFKKDN